MGFITPTMNSNPTLKQKPPDKSRALFSAEKIGTNKKPY
jgi:hypothetical protein